MNLLLPLGIILLIITLTDAFLIIFSLRHGGPITNFWTNKIWSGFLAIHRRHKIHKVLGFVGPAFLVFAVLTWYFMMYVSWLLIFLSHNRSAVVQASSAELDIFQKIYFIGATLSTVGYGDIVPSSFPWTTMATFATFGATFLITTSLSYMFPVISAASKRKDLAEKIFSMGEDAQKMVEYGWEIDSRDKTERYLFSIFSDLTEHTNKHMVYPVLRYFHNPIKQKSSTRAVLELADFFFLVSKAAVPEDRPSRILQRVAWSNIESFSKTKRKAAIKGMDSPLTDTSHLSREMLLRIGLRPVDETEFQTKLNEYKPLREKLLAICSEDGWG